MYALVFSVSNTKYHILCSLTLHYEWFCRSFDDPQYENISWLRKWWYAHELLLTRHFEGVELKLTMILLISIIVGNFLSVSSVFISLSHMHAKLLLCVVFYVIFVGWIMNDLQVENYWMSIQTLMIWGSQKSQILRASRFVAIVMQHVIFEKCLDFSLDEYSHFVIHLLLDYDIVFFTLHILVITYVKMSTLYIFWVVWYLYGNIT